MEQQHSQNTHAQSHYHKGRGGTVLEHLFLFSSLIIAALLCVCVLFFVFFSVVFMYLAPLFPRSPPPSVSLHLAARCLPSDVIAPVQNRRRLGIW